MSLSDIEVCHPTTGSIIFAAFWFADSLLEYWLGKTSKFKAASKWELIFMGLAAAALVLISKVKTEKKDI